MFTVEQKQMLQEKLDSKHVKPPKQYGPKGDYLEGWHVIAEANRIFGFDGWSYEVASVECVAQVSRAIGKERKDGFGVTYTSKVRVQVGSVIREDFGAGHGYDVDVGLAHESAIKEAVTDALKRALRSFGNVFGLALYDKTRANVETVDHDAPKPPKPISAAEQKRQCAEIDKDLSDCKTVQAVNACARVWSAKMDADGWSDEYRNFAIPKFKERRDQIIKETADNDSFPGDMPSNTDIRNVAGRPLHTMEGL